jgi:uncharacterized membrane protein YraQ (UPF0718 family)
MDQETFAFGGLTLAVVVGLALLIAGVAHLIAPYEVFQAVGGAISVGAVMVMAGYIDSL